MSEGPTASRARLAGTPEVGSRKSDIAYRLLKKAILGVELPPGALLVESDLMERFEVGRTPLREAIQRLEAEGLVEAVPRRGAFVSQLTPHDIRSIYELRSNLDAFAAELAAERAAEDEISRMEQLLEQARAGYYPFEAADFDEEMHRLIVQSSRNGIVEDFHQRLYSLTIRVLSLKRIQRESLEEMIEEFTPIVAAIRRRDGEAAALATQAHVMARGWFPDLNPYVAGRGSAASPGSPVEENSEARPTDITDSPHRKEEE